MTTLREQIALDLAATALSAADLAEQATYTPAGGAAATIYTLQIGVERRERAEVDDGNHDLAVRDQLIANDADTGVAAPAVGDTMTLDGKTWAVDEIAASTFATHRLVLTRQVRRRLAAPSGRLEGPR